MKMCGVAAVTTWSFLMAGKLRINILVKREANENDSLRQLNFIGYHTSAAKSEKRHESAENHAVGEEKFPSALMKF